MHLADVADETAMQTMVEAALARFGRIAMLIDNAADRQQTPLTEISPAEWRHITGIIVDGAFLCVRPCVPHMIAGGGGRGQHRRRKRAHGRTQSRLSSPLNRTTRGRDRRVEWIPWGEPPTRLVLRN